MNSSRAGTSPRWALRLIEFSPFIALAILSAVWFSIPMAVAWGLLDTWRDAPADAREMRAQWVDYLAAEKTAASAGLSGEASLYEATQESWQRWANSLPVRPSASDVTSPQAPPADVFEPVAEWERRSGARVWAWVAFPPARPSLVASAIPDPDSYEAWQSQTETNFQEYYPDGAEPFDLWDEFLRSSSAYGAMPPLQPDMFSRSGGGGHGSEEYTVTEQSLYSGEMWWRVFLVSGGTTPDDDGYVEMPPELAETSPEDPQFESVLQRVAKRDNYNILVFGPLDSETVPLRVPQGETPADARALGAAVWPEMQSPASSWVETTLRPLDERQRSLAGGEAGATQIASVYNSEQMGSLVYDADEVIPQSVAFLAVFDEMPGGAPTALDRAWRSWQRLVSGYFPYLIGGGIALLAITLVASPAAFVVDRRRTARQRAQEELAFMRRDAHDKVYNRLSALSKRIAVASDAVAADTSASLGAIAEDIRATVGELQEILGDETRNATSALSQVPIADQLQSVCTAQAARLGVQVVCECAEDVGEPGPGLGWDLQCIAEEAIANAARHGSAGKVRVTLTSAAGGLRLVVADDGSGSVVRSPDDAPVGSSGLRGMRDRLARHGGTLKLESGENGTTLTAEVPLR